MRHRLALLIACATLTGCASKVTSPNAIALPPETLHSLQSYTQTYVLAPGDQIEVNVEHLPEFTRTETIRSDGRIALPRLGELPVGGLAVPDANQLIASALAGRVRNPEVTVIVQNPREDMVFVAGEVGHPSAVPLRQARTVAEALILAGGATKAGAIREAALIRLDPDGRLAAHMIERRAGGQPGAYLSMQAVTLRAGDMILVPESNRSQFSRFVQDFINTPLSGANQLFTPYIQLRLLEQIR